MNMCPTCKIPWNKCSCEEPEGFEDWSVTQADAVIRARQFKPENM